MKNLCLQARTAAFAAASLALAVAGACDVPGQTVSTEVVGPGLIAGALSAAQASLTSSLVSLASLAAERSDAPPDLASPPDVQAADPNLNDVYIESIATNGKGCPKEDPDSVTTQIAEDRKSFLVQFRDMELLNPPGPKVKTTNCSAGVKLHVPGGWQVSLATITTRGLAILDKKIKANQTSTYFFAGNPLKSTFNTDIVGPKDYYFYDFTDVIPFESIVWSKCGTSAIFSINTTLILNSTANPTGEAIFNATSLDGGFEKILHYQWRKC